MARFRFAFFALFIFAGESFAQYGEVKSFTEPSRSIDLSASEMGTIAQILVKEGDSVEPGDVLASLNNDVLNASKKIAKQGINARGKLEAAIAEYKVQQIRFSKIEKLFNRQHASQAELDRVQGQMKIAAGHLQTVRDEIKIKSLELERIEAQLEQRRVRSPIKGIVTRVYKDQGEFVSANDPTVATVVQLNPLTVVFAVPNDKVAMLKAGNELPIKIGKKRNPTLGVIQFVSPTADAQSSSCRVKVSIDNSKKLWKCGDVCYLDLTRIVATKNLRSKQPLQVTHRNSR